MVFERLATSNNDNNNNSNNNNNNNNNSKCCRIFLQMKLILTINLMAVSII